ECADDHPDRDDTPHEAVRDRASSAVHDADEGGRDPRDGTRYPDAHHVILRGHGLTPPSRSTAAVLRLRPPRSRPRETTGEGRAVPPQRAPLGSVHPPPLTAHFRASARRPERPA